MSSENTIFIKQFLELRISYFNKISRKKYGKSCQSKHGAVTPILRAQKKIWIVYAHTHIIILTKLQ